MASDGIGSFSAPDASFTPTCSLMPRRVSVAAVTSFLTVRADGHVVWDGSG
ncbi:hypothetical protein RAJCM14343_0413 [Rhodococcus aetherivorans]|uniref:Uncharacterized protein n=1 Tax=Rhodococcus aetherivorans TaxID=191292 RepID=A0ABQ0YF66_9NOCA|nr:hypothetical protein RAJCM14343_0413 [Rhodococcus aetherivorans]